MFPIGPVVILPYLCNRGGMAVGMSSEICGGKFPEIYSNLSGNLLNNYFHFIIFNYNHIKK